MSAPHALLKVFQWVRRPFPWAIELVRNSKSCRCIMISNPDPAKSGISRSSSYRVKPLTLILESTASSFQRSSGSLYHSARRLCWLQKLV